MAIDEQKGKILLSTQSSLVSGSGSLSNFPVLVTHTHVPDEAWKHINVDGSDIRFSSDEVGVTELAFEIVKIDTTAKELECWVKVTSVSGTVNTNFYLWFGNKSATAYGATDTYGRNNVWTNYQAVYHFESLLTDSKGANDLTNNNTVGQATSKINQGANVTSGNTRSLSTTNTLSISTGACTFQVFAKMNTEIAGAEQFFSEHNNDSGFVRYSMSYEYNGGTRRIRYSRANSGISAVSIYHNGNLGTSTYNMIAMTQDGTNLRGYFNGAVVAGPTAATGTGSTTHSQGFRILNRQASAQDQGILANQDEMRVASTALSTDYLLSDYRNQNAPNTFTLSELLSLPSNGNFFAFL